MAQLTLVRKLHASPIYSGMALYGSGALHGVYLRQRFINDLDFMITPELFAVVGAYLDSSELSLEYTASPSGDPVLVYVTSGIVFPRIVINLDLKPRLIPGETEVMSSIFCPFGTSESVPVQALPLYRLLAEKIDTLARRGAATDFVDVYLGLKQYPELFPRIRSVLRPSGSHPCYIPEQAHDRLLSTKNNWEMTLQSVMSHFPEYTTVYNALCQWLPYFAS